MNKDSINYLVLSDIHLGHRTNKTKDIINHLINYFNVNNKIFKKLDIIFIAGDMFDRLLSNNSEEFIMSMDYLTLLAMYCKQHNIKLRILEGTPSHDWKQVNVFNSILKNLDIDIDFKYIETLHIEKMNDLGISILYVPDEYRETSIETLNEVKQLLIDNNLSKVDIAIMHGQFRYQLPILLESSHNEDEYLNIVKYFISIGHIHSSSVYDRILAQGSFDRLAHNEEEDKGAMYITIYNSGHKEYRFIPNKLATLFKTFNYNEDISIEEIKKDLDTIKGVGNVRLRINIDDNKHSNIKDALLSLRDKYKNLNIKIEYGKKESDNVRVLDIEKSNEGFAITKDNIISLITNRIEQQDIPNDIRNIILSEAIEIHKEIN